MNRNKNIKIKVNTNSAINGMYSMVKMFVLALITFIMIFTFVFRVATVDGSSMENTLYDKDKIIVTELYSKPEAGDIVVANSAETLGKIII